MIIRQLFSDPQFYFMSIFLVTFSICCHEYAHAQVALWEGDATAAEQGHLTLNPLKQMGLTAIIMLCIVGIAWGQVPVTKERMKHRYSDALISFAGPGMNLILFICFTITFSCVLYLNPPTGSFLDSSPHQLLFYGALLNFVLFVFNLIPVPPFDGFFIAQHFFPKLGKENSEFLNGLSLFILLAVFMGIDFLYQLGYEVTINTAIGILHLLDLFKIGG